MFFNLKSLLRVDMSVFWTYVTRALLSILLASTITTYNYGQKVGIVLSGGGASGLAHIGFLRALEENNIPIDYISGTSMGALVGAMYASGYSTEDMERLFSSEEFNLWTSGKIDERYVDYFKRNSDDASWIRLKITLDSILESNLPTNIINSTSLDFGLAELFGPASAVSENDFDKLFIPFRCNASDITSKTSVVLKNGDLATAVRASISYPFYINPVKMDGKLLYDGGLYDNFPVSVLCHEFEPDYIIGNNVSYNFPAPDEDNVLSQIRSMMSFDTKYEIECERGFVVKPDVPELGLLDFSSVSELINRGYDQAMLKIDSIKMFTPAQRSKEDVDKKRKEFNAGKPNLEIKDIEVSGLNKSETKYIIRSLRYNKKNILEFHELESRILKLASDEKIMRIDPDLVYSDSLKGFMLILNVKKEKNFFVYFGGNISNLSVNEGFVALQYNYLSQTPVTFYGNTYFGKFYSSGYGKVKMDFPAIVPTQLHASYTINKWDYFQNSSFLVEESAPSYLIHRENFVQGGMTFPVSYKGKLQIGMNNGTVSYEYYQSNEFTRFDTADVTDFQNNTFYSFYERNSLNRKQYANKGNRIYIKASMTSGKEKTIPGSNSFSDTLVNANHEWFSIKARIDQYFGIGKSFKYGLMLEGLYSDQPAFSNYASSLLSAPAFEPIPESKTIFRSRFRSPQYGAVGIRTIVSPFKNFDIRLEGFMFKPFKEIVLNDGNQAEYLSSSDNQYFIGSFTLAYDLSFTQVAFNVNYYDNFNEKFPSNRGDHYTFMFHLGFVLFNQKMLE